MSEDREDSEDSEEIFKLDNFPPAITGQESLHHAGDNFRMIPYEGEYFLRIRKIENGYILSYRHADLDEVFFTTIEDLKIGLGVLIRSTFPS
jgi:hypothetical protein